MVSEGSNSKTPRHSHGVPSLEDSEGSRSCQSVSGENLQDLAHELQSLAAAHAAALGRIASLLTASIHHRPEDSTDDAQQHEQSHQQGNRLRASRHICRLLKSSISSVERTDARTITCSDALEWPTTICPREWQRPFSSDGPVESFLVGKINRRKRGSVLQELVPARRARGNWVLSPHSLPRACMDLATVTALAFDVVTMPVLIAWNTDLGPLTIPSSLALAALWTLDFGFSCVTSHYLSDGGIETDLGRVLWKNLKGFLPLEACLVIVEWFNAVVVMSPMLQGGSDETNTSVTSWRSLLRAAKLARLARIVRVLKVIRSTVLQRVMQRFVPSAVLSNASNLGVLLLKIIGGLLWCAHILACVWYAVGSFGHSDTGLRWTALAFEPFSDSGGSISFSYSYLSSLQWIFCNLLAGATDVVPLNSAEFAVAVITQFVGLFVQCSAVAMLSSVLMDLTLRRQKLGDSLRLVNFFLRQRCVSPFLAARVSTAVAHSLRKQKMMTPDDVPQLTQLPRKLHEKLMVELHWSTLQTHCLFLFWKRANNTLLKSLCAEAMEVQCLDAGEELFPTRRDVSSAYAVSSGHLSYVPHSNNFGGAVPVRASVNSALSGNSLANSEDVPVRSWLCEATLWCHWTTVGQALAKSSTQVLGIAAESLLSVAERNPVVCSITRSYASAFHARVQASKPPMRTWPTDLSVPGTSFEEIVIAMNRDEQTLMSSLALQHLESKLSEKDLWLLWQEVDSGCCVLFESDPDRFKRVSFVLALETESDEGLVLVELGKAHDALAAPLANKGRRGISVTCRLPGVRQHSGESFESAAERLLNKLGPVAAGLAVAGCKDCSDAQDDNFAPTLTRVASKRSMTAKPSKPTDLQHMVPMRQVQSVIQATLSLCDEAIDIPGWHAGFLDAGESADGIGFRYYVCQAHGFSRCLAWLTSSQWRFWRSDENSTALKKILRLLLQKRQRLRLESEAHEVDVDKASGVQAKVSEAEDEVAEVEANAVRPISL